ncbi:DNA polymerase zeta catalytic subunit isoform X1 [Lucilia cuprina]|uniref:DNA polymerase zeta catalytic subunit isoform X1 n=3 Tax=Lucilia cuprina TaxID=7375 RepID=UPI001F05E1EE|nr:DNA polymerase zeta catalytic subunit isoform X1 [Lucilia cuprina]
MSGAEGIFSLRLVIADFYMEKPVPGLDACYSEFRGKEIKRVPVIRIFGPNAQGQKTCMHVHGVFPYFYIPYDQKDFESLNKAIYQIALNLDKAINISLSQGSSSAQHVFKIQLVKGIPFYGYHRSDHQYLKIYMFNPHFVRRAANLLQNGAILNKNFHPHESHVPYILQFMIDYNLYGMSFLHIPLEIVKFRRSDTAEVVPFRNLHETQMLDVNVVKKISCSTLEIDIGSNFILNRFQLITKTNTTHTNPGIESIWNDERLRRQKLAKSVEDDEEKLNAIPRLEIPATQERPDIQPTESEIFYRTALLSKLLAMETSILETTQISNQTLNSSLVSNVTLNPSNTSLNSKQQKRTFNLTKILQNSVYPEECTQNDNLINASVIPNHLNNTSIFEQSLMAKSNETKEQEIIKTAEDESVFLEDTIVDEELVLSLTQQQNRPTEEEHVPMNVTLREEDMELLDILQQLEENNEDKIDLDSSLAPMSQSHKNFPLSPQELDKETTNAALHKPSTDTDSEDDQENDDNTHDFSIALENLDDLILKLTQSQKQPLSPNENAALDVPQVDGADDLLRTPTKAAKTAAANNRSTSPHTPTTPKNRRLTMGSPCRSPRTPKTGHKYAALPLVSIDRSTGKTKAVNDTTPLKQSSGELNSLPMLSLRKKLALSDMRRKSISVDTDVEDRVTAVDERTGSGRRRSKRLVNLDKTHVTCALTPRRTNEKLLKVYSLDNKDIETNVNEEESHNIPEECEVIKDHLKENLKIKEKLHVPAEEAKESISLKVVTPAKTVNKRVLKATRKFPEKQDFAVNVPNNLEVQLKETVAKNMEAVKEVSSNSETDEEIIDSDETEEPIKNLRKTPNLKRLRRSFINANSAKRRKITITNTSSIVNSSKFDYAIDECKPNEIVTENHLKLKKCKVRLKKLLKSNEQKDKNTEVVRKAAESNFETLENANDALNCDMELSENTKQVLNPKVSESVTTKEDNSGSSNLIYNKLEDLSSALKMHFQSSLTSKVMPETYHSKMESIEIMYKSPKDDKSETNNHNIETDSQNLENLQDALKLLVPLNKNCKNNEVAIENLTKTPSLDIFPVSQIKESSDEEISETPFFDILSNTPNKECSDEEITETLPQETNKDCKVKRLGSSKSINLQSPIIFTQNSSPVLQAQSKTTTRSNSLHLESYITISSSSNNSSITSETNIVLTPLDLPPSREEVLKGCRKFQLPEYDFQQPFYSNPDDITKHKELGFTVLQIPGNKLNDIEEFQSILGTDVKGLTSWRRQQLIKLGGVEMLNKYRNPQRIREYFANKKTVIITPQVNAPTRQEAKLWLKARELLKTKGEEVEDMKMKNLEEDSPIKIRRQKVTMMMNAGDAAEADSDDGDNSLDCSSRSLTLTPLTPGTPVANEHYTKGELKKSFTPVSRNLEKVPLKLDSSLRKRKNYRIFRRVALNKQLKEAFDKEASKESSQELETVKDSQGSAIPNSQNSETSVSSETALAELERSSFMQQLKEADVTIGGFSENSTLNNTFGFKVALENLQQAKADVEFNYLTIVTLEVFVATRDDLFPNPQINEIRCLFYAIENSIPNDHIDVDKKLPRKACGYIMVHDSRDIVAKEGRIHGIDNDIEVTIVQTEVEALEALLGLCSRWDPDIYAGYEIEMSSWGFVIERAKYLCLNIAPLLSRVPTQKVREFVDEDRESFTDLDVEMKLCGRILLDVWRLLRSEIALTSYTFENVMYHIMHKRCPWHSYRNLTEWFSSPCSRWIVIEYYLERVRGTLALLDQLDLIGRTSEMAKLIGIQFYEVLSRGSQFRVESMMLRIAKPKNLVPLSPSVQQRAHMRAPEYLALIMEPQSRFYADPLIVLDFQSLYPSMIIAYNYCFSTCLGRVEHLGQSTPFEFGASQLRVSPAMLRKLVDRDLITISPCGVVFVKSAVREGILPRMLTEILDTRQMVKQSMKLHKSNSALQRILHSRQLGLKLMANVTYGYTAANFSGRMPAVEVGDSVVSKGRETLERAIKMVEANDKWNVRVVYGDTDSMFVLVPGRNREEAFRIGEEIAEAVTKQNPHPVKLKLEKVYQPCILQTKKRYVGYMYETPDQKEPVYEAKGIETVRRDGCPMVAKMLEKVLRILFETTDVSQVKHYVCRQFTKLLSGRANLQDLIFAKEFRGLNGYRPTACVPALELTRKWIQSDPRRIPRRGERVLFIITNGPPGVPLIRLVRHPHEVLSDEGLKINAVYYITKAIIPPLNRCLLLIGADVSEWFANLPRKILLTPALSTASEIISCPNPKSKKSTISQFFSTTNCIVDCGRQTKRGICMECSQNSTRSMIILQSKISKIERSYLATQHICQACCGRVGDLKCGSLDCPVLYVLEVKRRDLQQIMHFRNIVEERF